MYLVYIAFLTIVFSIGSVYFKTPERCAWIISAVNSLILSCVGIWKLYRLIFESKGIISREDIFSSDLISLEACKLFVCGNVLDLVYGSIFYPKQIELLSGWLHHCGYFVVLYNVLQKGAANGFAFSFIEEIPTFIKALGSLFPNLRSDNVFGISFFAFRILFHIHYLYQLYINAYEYFYWKFVLFVFFLHAYWMYCWILGMNRRNLKNKLTNTK